MKANRAIFLMVALVMSLGIRMDANITQTYQVFFTGNDYQVQTTSGLTLVESDNENDFYLDKGIGLPVRQFHIAIPAMYACSSIDLSYGEHVELSENVDMAQVPKPIPADAVYIPEEDKNLGRYEGGATTPSITLLNQTNYKEGTVLTCGVSPFSYSYASKCLGYHTAITISLNLEPSPDEADFNPISELAYGIWEKQVLNPKEFESIFSFVSGPPSYMDAVMTASDGDVAEVDYLLITKRVLSTSFDDLIAWKTTKGLRCAVVTLETIKNTYVGKTVQEQVKRCIYDYWLNRGTKYVLIGGDESIVPSPKCSVRTEDKMPTDLYYSCFANQFDWDKNGNGILGEVEDNCSYIPDVAVSRLLVSTRIQAINISKNIVSYEKDPQVEIALLMMGKHLNEDKPPVIECDTRTWARAMYTADIQPYWTGSVRYSFDTSTKQLTDAALINTRFNEKYSFVSLFSHGTTSAWSTHAAEYYTPDKILGIQRQDSPGTIITTIACNTNAFDRRYDSSSPDYGKTCLSQSFIQTPSSGVIAYLGCSRSGLYYPWDPRGGFSFEYESMYYKTLFSSPSEFRHYGQVVAAAKGAMAGLCSSEFYRWLQYGLNPIGDPEMPIYLHTPKVIPTSAVTINRTKSLDGKKTLYTVELSESGCTVCITGKYGGEDVQIVYENYGKPYFPIYNFPQDYTICITKPGYKPSILVGSVIPLPGTMGAEDDVMNARISSCALDGSELMVQVENLPECTSGSVLVSDIMGQARFSMEIEDNKATMSTLSMSKGLYVVGLRVNGELTDTKRITIP